jgi:chemotaxis protein methyltransferase CheR
MNAISTPDPNPNMDLSARDFDSLSRFIGEASGIRISATKKTMVEGRLRGRVRALGFATLRDYCIYLFREGGLAEEGDRIIDAITTNKTDFFREVEHFHFLTHTALPELTRNGAFQGEPLRTWSCAASIGAEAYSLAMVLADYSSEVRSLRFSVLATDICNDVLGVGAEAIYPEAMTSPIPQHMRARYLMRSRDRSASEVRIVPELRERVSFARLNLVDPGYRLPTQMQIAFCRNVLIYFDKATQHTVLSRICESIVAGGYLFVGHSETITGFSLPLRQVAPTVFARV